MRYDLNVMKSLGSVDETVLILKENSRNLNFDLEMTLRVIPNFPDT